MEIHIADDSVETPSEYFGPDRISDYAFPVSAYTSKYGLDSSSLFGTSLSLTDNYAVIGSSGYGVFVRQCGGG